MNELLARAWDDLIGRLHGPLTLRLLLQPAMAMFFATRSGLRDARAGRTPYFWAVLSDPANRREMLREGWRDVGKIFALAVILDVAYQIIVIRWVYPGETLAVAFILALLPYLIVRGSVTRIAQLSKRRRGRKESTDARS